MSSSSSKFTFDQPVAHPQNVLNTITTMVNDEGDNLFVNNVAVFQFQGFRLPFNDTFLTNLRRALPQGASLHLVVPGNADDRLVLTKDETSFTAWEKTPHGEEAYVKLGLQPNGLVEEIYPNVKLTDVHTLPEHHRAARLHAFAVSCNR